MKTLLSVAIISIAVIILFTQCRKSHTAPQSILSYYISKMGNTRIWHGEDVGGWEVPDDSGIHYTWVPFYNVLNDTFALAVDAAESTITLSIGGPLIQDPGGIYKCYSLDTIAKVMDFAQVNPTARIYYYYAADSIVITAGYNGTGGDETIYLKTP